MAYQTGRPGLIDESRGSRYNMIYIRYCLATDGERSVAFFMLIFHTAYLHSEKKNNKHDNCICDKRV